MSFNPNKPYNSLPKLPPKKEVETKEILKRCIEARSLLSELKASARLLPNQSILIKIIPLLEARDSSAIENIVTTTDKLFKYADHVNEKTDSATKETLRYRGALKNGFEHLKKRPLSVSTAVEVCSSIKNQEMEIRKIPGTSLANDKTGKTIYTPPAGEEVIRSLLKNWENFLNTNQEIDPLVRMAIGHYQFEAIHPFLDSNGRTGRILNILFLIQEELLDTPILYLSHSILRSKEIYYKLLLEVTKHNNWEEWIAYILSAISETCTWTLSKIDRIQKLSLQVKNLIKDKESKIYSQELVDLIFSQPYCRISNLVDSGIAQRQAASVYLKKLCDLGILNEVKEGREKIFIHPKLIRLLNK